MNRERVVRTLTFWLRPEFVLRVVNRFQKVAGFDRSIALASSALTATIPLMIVASAVASELGGKGTADRIIDRYELTGGGAEAVRDIFAPASGTSTSLGIVGFLFLMVAVLSFSRAVQRLFEQTWELEPAERPQHLQRAALDRRARGCTPRSAASSRPRWGTAASSSRRRCSPRRCRRSSWSGAAGCSAPSGSRARTSCRSASSERPCSRLYSVGAAVYVPHLFTRTPPATA